MSEETLRAIQEATHDLDLSTIIGLVVRHRDREMRLYWPDADGWSAYCEVEVEFGGEHIACGEGDTPLTALDACADDADRIDTDDAPVVCGGCHAMAGEDHASYCVDASAERRQAEPEEAEGNDPLRHPLNIQLPAVGVKNDLKLERFAERGAAHLAAALPTANAEPAGPEVERLDLSRPPPGYEVGPDTGTYGIEWWWYRPAVGGEGQRGDAATSETEALAATQEHWQARCDPPGMWVEGVGDEVLGGLGPSWGVVDHEAVRLADSETDARAAAWRWYLRRLVLVDRLERSLSWRCACGDGLPGATLCLHTSRRLAVLGAGDLWPRALTWPDADCEAAERWLVDSTAEMPEVFRG